MGIIWYIPYLWVMQDYKDPKLWELYGIFLTMGSAGLRTLNYGNYGIFLIMGTAGFVSSTPFGLLFGQSLLGFTVLGFGFRSYTRKPGNSSLDLLVGYHGEPKVNLFHNRRII